jgi:hypothetical protein
MVSVLILVAITAFCSTEPGTLIMAGGGATDAFLSTASISYSDGLGNSYTLLATSGVAEISYDPAILCNVAVTSSLPITRPVYADWWSRDWKDEAGIWHTEVNSLLAGLPVRAIKEGGTIGTGIQLNNDFGGLVFDPNTGEAWSRLR